MFKTSPKPSEHFSRVARPSFTCEVGDGWSFLVAALLAAVHDRYVAEGIDAIAPSLRINQIKEKRGRLSVHIDSILPVDDLIEKYENLSSTVCEVCGQPGRLTEKSLGWLATRCQSH